jgi:hypothetical protein
VDSELNFKIEGSKFADVEKGSAPMLHRPAGSRRSSERRRWRSTIVEY